MIRNCFAFFCLGALLPPSPPLFHTPYFEENVKNNANADAWNHFKFLNTANKP